MILALSSSDQQNIHHESESLVQVPSAREPPGSAGLHSHGEAGPPARPGLRLSLARSTDADDHAAAAAWKTKPETEAQARPGCIVRKQLL